MFISIIVPICNENYRNTKLLLDNLNNQKKVKTKEIEVIIVQDQCHNKIKLSKKFLNKFNFSWSYIRLNKEFNINYARQIGIENSSGDYIIFFDCFGRFYKDTFIQSLQDFINNQEDKPDIIISNWLEKQYVKDDNLLHINHKCNEKNLFGKIFKREFLLNNSINFSFFSKYDDEKSFLKKCKCTQKIVLYKHIFYCTYFNKKSYYWMSNSIYNKYYKENIYESNRKYLY